MKTVLPGMLALLALVVALSACASSDTVAVEQVVIDSEHAAELALNGQGSAAAVDPYFATFFEGGNIDTQINHHVAYTAVLTQYPRGKAHLDKFQINGVTVDSTAGEARVTYQVNVTVLDGTGPHTATVTQHLLVVKTPQRGWRIQAGDGPDAGDGDNSFLGNLLSQ